MAFVETPRTGYNDSTELAIDDLSPEKTWHSPVKRGNDLVSRLRNARNGGLDLRTPNARNPLAVRPNQQAGGTDEISLLLKSTSRPSGSLRGKENYGVPQTPAVLRNGYKGVTTPALDTGDSLLLGSDMGSFMHDDGGTPLPEMPSSSTHSTPVAQLPGQGMNNLLADQRNQMTLREQENTIDRIEKENFGLKLKIHYFEDLLRKADPNYNKTALKENVDLKVERMQLQRDVGKLKKQLKGSEMELQKLREQILALERRGGNGGKPSQEMEIEITRLRQEYEEVQHEANELREELRKSSKHSPELEKLRGEVEDLEADLRQKDVEIQERDEKLEKMDDEISKLQAELDEREESGDKSDEIEELKARLKETEDDNRALQKEVRLAKESAHDACEQDQEELKDKITDLEADNRALQNELDVAKDSRQGKVDGQVEDLKDKISDLEADNRALQDELDQAKESHQDNDNEEKLEQLREKISDLEADNRALQNELDQAKETQQDNDDGQLEELKDKISDLEAEGRALQNDLDLAKEARDDAQEQKDEALADLRQMREDMGDRSMHPRGFAEEVEQKARKLERELRQAVTRYETAESELKQKASQTTDMQSRMDLSREEARSREHALKTKVKSYEEQVKQLSNRHASSDERIASIRKEMDGKVNERDSLQVRNDKLDRELQTLRNDIARYRLSLEETQTALQAEKRHATENENALRNEAHKQISELRASISDLRQRLEKSQTDLSSVQDKWQAERRALVVARDQAEARVGGLEQSVHKLQNSHSDASGKESRLKDVLAGEEQRHRKEQNLLQGHIEELENELKKKQLSFDVSRRDELRLKEQARVAKEEVTNAERKIQSLEDEVQVLSRMAEDEQKRSEDKITSARAETDSIRKQLLEIKQQRQKAEYELRDIQDYTQRIPATPAATRDAKQKLEQRVRDLQSQLERARFAKDDLDTKLKRSEEDHATTRRRTLELEHDLRHTLSAKSQGSPTTVLQSPGSRRELEELRTQIRDARNQTDEERTKRKTAERDLRTKLNEAERSFQQQLRDNEQLRDELEVQIMDLESQLSEQDGRRASADKTVERLRTRIAGLEKDLLAARAVQTTDDTVASERQDLHGMLKNARLEAEELQNELTKAKTKLESHKTREREQKDLVKRLQTERTTALDQHRKLSKEHASLQDRHDQKRDKLTKAKATLDHQSQALATQKAQLASRPAALEQQLATSSHRHEQELAGLMKQIAWLRAKGKREEAFRAGLAFEKRFLLMNIDMFQSFNQLDLRLIEKMGITPDTSAPRKRPSLRAVAGMVLATVRMSNGATEWRRARKVKESLLEKAAEVVGRKGVLGKRRTAA